MNIIRSAKSFKNHAKFMPDILNINTRIMHYKPRLVRTLARFRLGERGPSLHGGITNDLSEPYGNLSKISPHHEICSEILFQ